jgi:hypothetical protein
MSVYNKAVSITNLKNLKEDPCIYIYKDPDCVYVKNGIIYIGEAKSFTNRASSYLSGELLKKLSKRLNRFDPYNKKPRGDCNDLENFISKCELVIRRKSFFKDKKERKKWEKLYIQRYKPFLNQEPWYGGYRGAHRRFYMSQLHKDFKMRCSIPVKCVWTGALRDNPSEEYIQKINNKFRKEVTMIKEKTDTNISFTNISGPYSSEDEQVLVCPGCGIECLHVHKTFNYSRGEDNEKVQRTTQDSAGNVKIENVENEGSGNPSARRDGLKIQFYCEAGCMVTLNIAQHKGNMFFKWGETRGMNPQELKDLRGE